MPVYPAQNELIVGNNLVDFITDGTITTKQKKKLDTDIVNDNTIIVKGGTTLEEDMTAASDIKDPDLQITLFKKGDIVPAGTEIPDNSFLVETAAQDQSTATDIDTGDTTELPEDDPVNTGTEKTAQGIERTIDAYLQQNYSEMTEWTFGYGEFKSREGDELVCLGNLFTDSRQNAIVISSTDPIDPELEAPAIAQYNHIDKFGESISKNRITAIAANGNEFIGSFLISYDNKYVNVNDRIEMFATDIKTGLEKVGIHLDGDNSTIKMVGSVELRQHADDSKDTLRIFDSLNTARVELTPNDIPSRSDAASGINIVDYYIPTVVFYKTASSDYIEITKNKNWHNPFVYYYTYNYYLKNYGISVSSTVNLGYIEANTMLDLSQLFFRLNIPQYLPSGDKLTDHTYYLDPQEVTSIKYTLKKNGKNVSGMTNVDLITNAGLSINGLDTDTFDISLNSTFLDDFKITSAGTYSLQFTVNAVLQGHRPDYGTKYENPYVYVSGSFIGGVTAATQPVANSGNDQSTRKLTIGTNGLSFTGNNSRYFYAATDGYEMKWDDNSVRLDSTVGLQLNKKYLAINSAYQCGTNVDCLICAAKTGGYTVTLPSLSTYGQCRELMVVGFDGLKLKVQSGGKIWNNGSELDEITFDSTIAPRKIMKLYAANNRWYVL